jgi:hypothetical protein
VRVGGHVRRLRRRVVGVCEDDLPGSLRSLPGLCPILQHVVHQRPQLGGRAVVEHCAVEELVHAVHVIGDHGCAAREHVEQAIGHEPPRLRRAPVDSPPSPR